MFAQGQVSGTKANMDALNEPVCLPKVKTAALSFSLSLVLYVIAFAIGCILVSQSVLCIL